MNRIGTSKNMPLLSQHLKIVSRSLNKLSSTMILMMSPKPVNIKVKKPPPLPVVVLSEYLINAKTVIGIQVVYHESKSTVVSL